MTAPIRVLIADDHQLVAQALRDVLSHEPDLEVVGVAYDGESAIREAARLQPDVVLMDIQMPGRDGVAATREIRAARPETKVVMLTATERSRAVLDAVDAGASGFIQKENALEDVIGAVRAAHQGEMLLAGPRLRRLLADLRERHRRGNGGAPPVRLTERELEVLQELAAGNDAATIAEKLVISPHTLRTHFQNIMHKFNAHSKLEVLTLAIRHGLIDVPRS
ncbi:MAG: response regulator transcription factor [Chloroflexota bacterium]|nr:response regulator transcription factor [Dehalococcoidia bacterium]MDW8254708.1 response regulator transcription factor [Chloroflexota bacterium]